MNKIVLAVCLVAVTLSGFNTYLLLQLIGKFKEIGEKIEPITKQLQQMKPPHPEGGFPPGPFQHSGQGSATKGDARDRQGGATPADEPAAVPPKFPRPGLPLPLQKP